MDHNAMETNYMTMAIRMLTTIIYAGHGHVDKYSLRRIIPITS